MTTKDHRILGKYLIRQAGGFEKKAYERAFVLGSVEPDYNIFTYIKGSVKNRLLMGHNFQSSLSFVKRAAKKLTEKDRRNWNVLDYYKLGKILHYVADDFTHPHNENYVGDLFDHCVYEFQLHRILGDYLNDNDVSVYDDFQSTDIISSIEKQHDEYLLNFASPVNDCKWISKMCWRTLNWFLCTEFENEYSLILVAA